MSAPRKYAKTTLGLLASRPKKGNPINKPCPACGAEAGYMCRRPDPVSGFVVRSRRPHAAR